jgi:hypothetical protein
VNYSITNLPTWLTLSPASSKSGTVPTSAKTVTFTINSSAHKLSPNTYVNSINFNNTTNNQGNQAVHLSSPSLRFQRAANLASTVKQVL